MWGRVVEFMLACWLAISPFIFGYSDDHLFYWFNDLGTSSAIAFFSLICFYRPLRKMHLSNLIVAFYLLTIAFLHRETGPYAVLQNYAVLGILLLMIAIIPTRAEETPQSWRDFYESR